MKAITIIRKQDYDLGTNTYFSNDIVLSSMRMRNGSISYNVYNNGFIDEDNLILEDVQGYHSLVKMIVNGEIK